MRQDDIRDTQETRPPAEDPVSGAQERTRPTERIERPAAGDVERPAAGDGASLELFPTNTVERFRGEWQRIQTRFVDDPRDAVRSADHLVDEVIRSLGEQKHQLEGMWQQESETEDLRQALRRYRSFFDQLLHA
jgi:hypothetical protein